MLYRIFIKIELGQPILSWLIAFLLLIRYVTLWPWPLIPNLEHTSVHRMSCDQSMHQYRTIRGWVIDNLANFCPATSHYVLDLGFLDHESLWYIACHVIMCSKFQRNWTIRGLVIDDLAHFRHLTVRGRIFLRTVLMMRGPNFTKLE